MLDRINSKMWNIIRSIKGEKLIIIVGTAHRVGSTWLFNMIKDLGIFDRSIGLIPKNGIETGTILLEKNEVIDKLRNINGYHIFKSHSKPVFINSESIKFISIFRDPRDVIVSNIFYLSHLDSKKGGWGKEFNNLSNKEKIKKVIREGNFIRERLLDWYSFPESFNIQYEALLDNPNKILQDVSIFLGLSNKENISHYGKRIGKVIKNNSFEKKTGRKVGEENSLSPIRKGIKGDWKNYFDKDLIKYFKEYNNGVWNELLITMGYEKNYDW